MIDTDSRSRTGTSGTRQPLKEFKCNVCYSKSFKHIFTKKIFNYPKKVV